MSLRRSKRYSYHGESGGVLRALRQVDEDRQLILSYSLESSLERSNEGIGTEPPTNDLVSSGSAGLRAQPSSGRDARNDCAEFSGSCSLPVPPLSSVRTRSSTWVTSLRSLLLHKQRSLHRRPQLTVPPGSVGAAPQSEEEMDRFLADVWSKDAARDPMETSSNYMRKVTELKSFYEQKLAEIAQREATYLSEYHDEATPLLTADQLSMNKDAALQRVLLEAQVHHKFNELRFKMKQEIVQSVLSLRGHYLETGCRRRRRLRPRATKLLSQWFDEHINNPYPSEHEKRVLAGQCDITVEQVSNWFGNKRSRSKSLPITKSWRTKSATL